MRKLFFLFFFLTLIPVLGISQNDYAHKEYYVVRLKYGIKKTGITCKFTPEIIDDKSHSLFSKIQVNEEEAILLTTADNKIMVIHTITSLLNELTKLGWNLLHLNEVKVLSDTYMEYIFEK